MRKLVLIFAAVTALVAVGSAQMMMMMGGDSPNQFLKRQDVKDDLKLSDDQNTKILAAAQDLQDASKAAGQQAFQEAQANGGSINYAAIMEAVQKTLKPDVEKYNDFVKSTLTPAQQKRLLQIYMQIQGDSSLTNGDVQKLVGLKDDQVAHIADLQKKMGEANKALAKRFQDKEIDGQTALADFQQNGVALKTELGKVLTEPQKAKFKDAQGPKFTLDPAVPLNSFGRPGGPAGGGAATKQGGGLTIISK